MSDFQREWRETIGLPDADSETGLVTLWPDRPLMFNVRPRPTAFPVRQWLRLIGELDIGWQWRQEAGVGVGWMYRLIDDALRPAAQVGQRFCLELAGKGERWPRNAFARAQFPPAPGKGAGSTPATARLSAIVRGQDVVVHDGGELVVEAWVYRRRPDRRPDDFTEPADQVIRIDLPQGSYDWQRVERTFDLPADMAGAVVRVGGRGFAGTVRLADVRLTRNGADNALPPLDRTNPSRPALNWVGENLSRKEWVHLSLRVDGATVFDGEVFHPGYRWPEIELPLPALDDREHRFELILRPTTPDPLPLLVRDAHLLRQSARTVELVGHPAYVDAGRPFPVLLELNDANGSRLVVQSIDAGPAQPNPQYTFDFNSERLVVRPARVVEHTVDDPDRPRLCSGDFYHVAHQRDAFLRYLAWYVHHRIGDAFCFRSSYQWTGMRDTDERAWRALVPLLHQLGMQYQLILDGRHINEAFRLNPPDAWIAGPGYRGRQAHEHDSVSYGVKRRTDTGTLFWDMFRRRLRETGAAGHARFPWRDPRTVDVYDRERQQDMAQAHAQFVEHQRADRGDATRHSGPSLLHRYFFEAGYSFVSTEMMYGTSEVLLAATRGATVAAGKREFGAHVATQWSSTPHDRPDRPLRHFLGLASAFIQGATDITSEDAMYRIEWHFAGHDRFSKACRVHRAAQRRMLRFMQTHPRRGSIRTPLAVLLGRHCGFDGWNRERVWCSLRPEFAFADPERSFDLLRVLFPRYLPQGIYRANCPLAPQGWFTGTPFGPVDLLPEDAPPEVLSRYAGAIMLGWNTASVDQATRFRRYVEGGGSLLLAQPHLSTQTTRVPLPASADPAVTQALLGTSALSDGVIETTMGQGRLVLSGAPVYPVHDSVRPRYEAAMCAIVQAAARREHERGWIDASADVAFTAYDWGAHRTIYLLNIDWWSDRTRHEATLRLGDASHPVAARRGRIETITIADGVAVWPDDPTMDVMGIEVARERIQITVQSDRGGTIRVMERTGRVRDVQVHAGGVQRVSVG